MDFEDLTEEDLSFLDGEVQKAMNNNSNNETSSVESEEQQYDQTFADCFDDDDDVQMEHLECLKSKFRHSSFREKQWDIVKALLLEKRDVCAVMATGYGKSLCYQFPAVYSQKMTLVICPLIALMQAQVFDLESTGISACYLGSAQKDRNILQRVAEGEFTIVYCSPEYLQTAGGDKLLSIVRERLAMIAIDEAHCVSQWGHDFRPDFRKLNKIRKKIPNTPILAVTATATENVRHDIITLLGLNQPKVVMTSFDRANLEFIVRQKTSAGRDLPQLVKDVNGSVIVYVLKRKVAEEIARLLTSKGINCDHYHAGMEIDKRTEVLKRFLRDELKVIVATNAFGMGIDKKDIRCVIHYGAAKNLETYYQEVGRAGRDGKASKVITFFCADDFQLHDWFLDDEATKKKLLPKIQNYLRSLGSKMRDFLYSTQCRRKAILEYFSENSPLLPRPNCCDNCTVGLGSWNLSDLYHDVDDNGVYDFAIVSKVLLQAIKCLQQRNVVTDKNLVKKFLIGKFDQRLRSVQYDSKFGSGQMYPEHHWLALIEQLTTHEYIEMRLHATLTLTAKANDWMRTATSLPLKAIGQMFEYFEKKSSTPLVVGQTRVNRYTVTRAVTDLMRKEFVCSNELFKQILSEVRDAIAVTKNVPNKDSIASMVDLDKMVKMKPKNFDEFRYGFNSTFADGKLNKYGPTFVNVISKFTNAQLEMQNVLLNNPMPNIRMDRVVSPQILRLLKDRKTMEEILRLTNLTKIQLLSDIETLIQTGQPILKTDLAYDVHIDFKVFRQQIGSTTFDTTPEMVNEVQTKYFGSTGQTIDSGFVRLALTYYAVRFHLNGLAVAYIDCEDNVLVNAKQLIVEERTETLNATYETDRHYPPIPNNRYRAQSFIDLLFGYYCPYDESQYDDGDEYHMYMEEMYEGGYGGIDEEDNEEEIDEESVEEIGSDDDETGASDSDYENERGIYGRKRRRV